MTNQTNIQNKTLGERLAEELKAAQFKSQNPLLSMTGPAGQVGSLLYLQQHPELMQSQQNLQNQPMQQPDLGNLNQGQSSIPSIMQQQQGQMTQQHLPNPQELLLQSIMTSLKPKQHQYAPSNLGKLQQEFREAQAGKYPGTDIPFESEQAKEDFLAPYREKLGGLKQGQHYIYDPESHEKIGVEREYTPKERNEEEGRAFFNKTFPIINEGIKDFVGKDSIKNFMKYANEYGKNDVATQKMDNLLLAQRLMGAGLVKEAAHIRFRKNKSII